MYLEKRIFAYYWTKLFYICENGGVVPYWSIALSSYLNSLSTAAVAPCFEIAECVELNAVLTQSGFQSETETAPSAGVSAGYCIS